MPKLPAAILSTVDQTALADMCVCVARLEDAERQIDQLGLLVAGERGLVKNPACQLARQYRESYLRWSQRFGLTPADRERIIVPEAAEDDPFDDWIRNRGAKTGS